MLKQLIVENFVLLDKLELDFCDGYSVITGETGAGKSLIADAIQGVTGGKLSPDQIKMNCKSSYIEATFTINKNIKKLLELNGFEDLEETITLSRTLQRSGNKCRINGELISLNLLKQVGESLIDIIGQHDNQYLFKTDRHRIILDLMGDKKHKELIDNVSSLAKKLNLLKNEYQELDKNSKESKRQLDFFKFELKEISEAELKIGEDEELKQEREKLVHAEELSSNLMEAYQELYSGENISSIRDRLNSVSRNIMDCVRYAPELESINNQLDEAIITIEEVARSIRDISDDVDLNPETLYEVEQRLNLVIKLKNKYGGTIEDIIKYQEELSQKVSFSENSEEKLEQLLNEINIVEKDYREKALSLHNSRIQIAETIEPHIEKELSELGMDKTKFKVNISVKEENHISENGIDFIEFLISPNPGEPLRSLSKTASGGEISRIMLALRMVLQKEGQTQTLIFDEIDTGISGKAALTVSEKIGKLSQDFQIICITHLPVVACMSDEHLWIEKSSTENETNVSVFKLSNDKRIEKLAQMSGGKINQNALDYAKDIYENALKYKKNFNKVKI
jgi:DNA repair protein RecN (Recombination protein N)